MSRPKWIDDLEAEVRGALELCDFPPADGGRLGPWLVEAVSVIGEQLAEEQMQRELDGMLIKNLAEKLGIALKLETYRLQKAKAEIANLELDRAAGLLVERAEVEYVLAEFASTYRTLLENLADRLAPAIAVHRGDVAAIHAEIDMASAALLNEMSDAMKRKMDGCTAG